MDSRNPSEKKRRTIEGLLSTGKSDNQSEELDDVIQREEPLPELETVLDTPVERVVSETVDEPHIVEDDFEATHILKVEEMEESEGEEIEFEAAQTEDYQVVDAAAMEKRKSSNLIKYIAIAIVAIGISAAGLILIRDHIYSFFSGFVGEQAEQKDQSKLIKELRSENSRLSNLVAEAEKDSVEIRNLRTANGSLQSMLDVEKEKSQRLEEQVSSLRAEGEQLEQGDNLQTEEEPGQVSEKIKQLQAKLEEERIRGDDLAEQLQDLNRRMIGYSRENSRLNQELDDSKEDVNNLQYLKQENNQLRNQKETLSRQLRTANSQIEVLQSNADKSTDSSTQLEKVNLEYRRVLDLLQESRDANNIKQKKVDELLSENTLLQSKVTRLERNQGEKNERYAAGSSSSNEYGQQSSRSSDSGVTAPYPIDIVRPQYPNSAWRRKVGGIVTLRVYITKYGDVSQAEVVSSPDRLRALDKAALAAVKQWKFMPGKRNGRPVDMWHDIPLEFTMNRE